MSKETYFNPKRPYRMGRPSRKKQSWYDKEVSVSVIGKAIIYFIGFMLLFMFIKYGIEQGIITTF